MRSKPSITEQTCKRCGNQWFPRQLTAPVRCPKCKSPYWNRDPVPKKEKS